MSDQIAAVLLTVVGRRAPISAHEFAAVSAWAFGITPEDRRNELALKLIYSVPLEAYNAFVRLHWQKLEDEVAAAGLQWPEEPTQGPRQHLKLVK